MFKIFYSGNLKERDNLGGLGIDGRIKILSRDKSDYRRVLDW
jgi:hypothetical protein